MEAIKYVQNNEREICGDFVIAFGVGQSLTVGAAIVVPVVNMILTQVLSKLSHYERYCLRIYSACGDHFLQNLLTIILYFST